jgi:endo-1,4-beta-D-glucanase Y
VPRDLDTHDPSRRDFLGYCLGAAVAVGAATFSGSAQAAFAANDMDWRSFKDRFMAPDGRIIDTGNNGISHSEGQSYGMLFAVTFGDRQSFDLIHGWTVRNLTRKTDALHVWRYLPDSKNHSPDQNNATDGDLVIAFALSRAARIWQEPQYAAAAIAIASDIRRSLIVNAGSKIVLLPALTGFTHKTSVTVNLSYYNFVAFRELSVIDPSPLWQLLELDGLSLIQAARFGKWQLPPDWLSVGISSGTASIAAGWPPLSSFDAIRVPLNLTWAAALPADTLASFTGYWTSAAAYQPAWANLKTDQVSPYAAPSGLVAIKAVTLAGSPQMGLPALPSVNDAKDYYSAALTLLARIAWTDSHGTG